MNRQAAEIRDFMRVLIPQTATFITTLTADGRPLVRQVTAVVGDDFTVEVPSARHGLKAGHVRRNGIATMLWVALEEAVPARTVSLMGRAEVIEDEAAVTEFLVRRNALYSTNMQYNPGRCVIRVTPQLLRAEKFRGDDRSRPVVIRDFSTFEVLEIDSAT